MERFARGLYLSLSLLELRPVKGWGVARSYRGGCVTVNYTRNCSRVDILSPFSGFYDRLQLASSEKRHAFIKSSSTFSGSSVTDLAGPLPSLERPYALNGVGSDKYEKLWQSLFSDSSQWWDNRSAKPTPRFPDFKHKRSGEGLWVNNRQNPPWVASKLASITLGMSVFSCTIKLSEHNKAGQYLKTLELFDQMEHLGINADGHIFVQVLNACSALQALDKGRRIHRQIVATGCEFNVYVSNSLVDMYAKCGSLDDAWKVFERMPNRDVIVWNGMIMGCVKCGESLKALELFQQMQRDNIEPNSRTYVGLLNACASMAAIEEGRLIHDEIIRSGFESDVYVSNSLVDMYVKCGSTEDAWRVFETMPTRNVVAWNAIILSCVKEGHGLKALQVFHRMQREGVEPSSATFVALLNACARLAALEKGRHIHEQIIRREFDNDVCVCNSLVDMYARCGSMEDARRVFDNMPKCDVVGWNAMIMGYAMNGLAKIAVELFEQMSITGSEIDEVTFICLLSACSHGSLVMEGLQYFEGLGSVYGVSLTLEHFTCMIDILGRAGHLHAAEELIKNMSLDACLSAWMALLGACRIHGNVEIGELASKRVLQLDPENAAGYVLLSNLYGATGDLDTQAVVQEQRLENRAQKEPGCTWIEVNNELHSFVANDGIHPQIHEIQEELAKLFEQMNEAGYVPDMTMSFLDGKDENMPKHLCHHSEKLAIAFGLIRTPAGVPLRMTQNLRVCRDCHNAIKFIAKIVGRKITVRDANRFHHFEDGICSCGDY